MKEAFCSKKTEIRQPSTNLFLSTRFGTIGENIESWLDVGKLPKSFCHALTTFCSEFEKDESKYGTGLDSSDPGPFFPQWQTSPIRLAGIPIYNWYVFGGDCSEFALCFCIFLLCYLLLLYSAVSIARNNTILAVVDTHKVVLTDSFMIAFPNETEKLAEIENAADWMAGFITTGEDSREP